MKLSNETIDILKNFATISTNILFREGQELSTISVGKSVFAKARIKEEIPREFAIYDLNSLLSLLTFKDDQEIEFGEKSLIIRKDSAKFEYFYSSPQVIVAAPQKSIPVDFYESFEISKEDVLEIMKVSSILAAPSITFEGNGSEIVCVVGDKKNDTYNSYSKALGKSAKVFKGHMAVTNFRVMQDDYEVVLDSKKLIHMTGTNKGVSYFIALEPDSTLE